MIFFMLLIATTLGADVTKVAVLHRHGQREAAVLLNGTTISWDGCALTTEGKKTMNALGTFLRQRYDAILTNNYSLKRDKTHSTHILRTQQSALALLSTLWAVDPVAYPIVEYPPPETDFDLEYWFSWPAYILRQDLFESYAAAHDIETQNILGKETLQAIGLAIGASDLCSNHPTTCVVFAQDLALSNSANGKDCPVALCNNATLALVLTVMRRWYHFSYAFMNDAPFQEQIGRNGFRLMSLWAEAFTSPSDVDVFHHYSAHDSTMIGVYNTIGMLADDDVASPLNLPSFGDVFLLEYDTTGAVTAWLGHTNLTYGSDHAYTLSAASIRCRGGPDNQTYMAPSCPLADFVAALRYHAMAKSPYGVCYANTSDMQRAGCDATPVGSACQQFRALCPSTACEYINGVVDVARGMACVSRDRSAASRHDDDPAMTVALSSLVTALVCAILFFVCGLVRQHAQGERPASQLSLLPVST